MLEDLAIVFKMMEGNSIKMVAMVHFGDAQQIMRDMDLLMYMYSDRMNGGCGCNT